MIYKGTEIRKVIYSQLMKRLPKWVTLSYKLNSKQYVYVMIMVGRGNQQKTANKKKLKMFIKTSQHIKCVYFADVKSGRSEV